MRIKEKEVKIEERFIKWFSDLSKEDVKLVGGKAANLGEMRRINMPVPNGFAITTEAYSYFLEETELKEKIYEMLEIDEENTRLLEETAKKIRVMIENAEMPQDLRNEIIEAYEILSVDKQDLSTASGDALSILKMSELPFVAVRSSATAEDSSTASFAGQQESFLNIKGREDLIEAVKKCFASLFTARSVYYRVKKGFKHENVLIAVIVQEMVNADKSGVIFSKNPVDDTGNIVIEAVFGLGEGIVSGRIQPDQYFVSREFEILDKKIADKKIAIVRTSSGKEEIVKLIEERSKQQVLTNYEIKRLADYSMTLEQHYNSPQDIEFAIDSGNIYIVQTRPITTINKARKGEEIEGKELLQGLAASPGIGSGEVKIVRTIDDLAKIKKGDVLVTKMTNPDMVVTMQKSNAIVTDEGGMTSHAAIVSREMGIPAVVGTRRATEILREGAIITVDGFKGKVYEGLSLGKKVEILPIVPTNTTIKVIVDLPDFAERAAKTNCKEVGLLRLEGIIAESGKHPYYFLKKGIDNYEEIIYSGISKIAEYFDELWVRTSDIRSDEFKNLEGAPELELNPMLGMHGIRAGLKHKEILEAEIKAMKKISETKKIGIMMPQIISIEEVKEVKKIIEKFNAKLKLGIMVETPAAVQIIESLCQEGIKFISFGTNDLTQFTLAIDRGNEKVQYLYNEMNPAVLSQLKHVIEVCKKYNVETSICGQAGSNKEMVEFLVKYGIDSISVNADKAKEISLLVKELEDKGLRGEQFRETRDNKLMSEVASSELGKEEHKNYEHMQEIITRDNQRKKEKKREEKQRHKVRCSECNKETEVPFQPDGVRPVYCKECFEKHKLKKEFKEQAKKDMPEFIEKIQETAKEIEENIKEKIGELEEIGKEVVDNLVGNEENGERQEESKKEDWEDVDFGIDVFSGQHEGEKDNSEEHIDRRRNEFYDEVSEDIIEDREGESKKKRRDEERKEYKENKRKEEQEEGVVLDIF